MELQLQLRGIMIRLIVASFFVFHSLFSYAATAQTVKINSETGAKTWEDSRNGVHFSLTQLLPDQIKAFYVNRGFTLKQIEPYAASCVYMTVLRNDSAPGTIHFLSSNWSVLVTDKAKTIVSVDKWLQRLSALGANKSSLIAFRWAQFPPEQEYEPGGDWNQGMLSIDLPPKDKFDVIARWDMNGKSYDSKLMGVECAK